ncbi:MAG: response regulator transcription factor [Firmicutes bacterium]|nr:response regulator transcription factor [Bacillota bacterium]
MIKNILIIDDEEQILEVVEAYLMKDEYNVFKASNGKDALDIFNKEDIHFIVLDLMLPDLSGEEVCKKIRSKSNVPILMLTAKVSEGDRIKGLDIGADDYMVKPFSVKELLARIRAIKRRLDKDIIKKDIIRFNNDDLVIDKSKMEVIKKGEVLNLTPTEFNILKILSKNKNKVFSREELVINILGFDYDGYDRTIDTHIKNLRRKIEDDYNKYIKTVYGVGYRFIGG